MSEDRGKKFLEFEELILDSGKKALDLILKDCAFCNDTKFITHSFVNANGMTVEETKPCPRCNKEIK
jgi:hypothetical protein